MQKIGEGLREGIKREESNDKVKNLVLFSGWPLQLSQTTVTLIKQGGSDEGYSPDDSTLLVHLSIYLSKYLFIYQIIYL